MIYSKLQTSFNMPSLQKGSLLVWSRTDTVAVECTACCFVCDTCLHCFQVFLDFLKVALSFWATFLTSWRSCEEFLCVAEWWVSDVPFTDNGHDGAYRNIADLIQQSESQWPLWDACLVRIRKTYFYFLRSSLVLDIRTLGLIMLEWVTYRSSVYKPCHCYAAQQFCCEGLGRDFLPLHIAWCQIIIFYFNPDLCSLSCSFGTAHIQREPHQGHPEQSGLVLFFE